MELKTKFYVGQEVWFYDKSERRACCGVVKSIALFVYEDRTTMWYTIADQDGLCEDEIYEDEESMHKHVFPNLIYSPSN